MKKRVIKLVLEIAKATIALLLGFLGGSNM